MRCVHCLQEAGRTKDHIFPRLWYPQNTPDKTQRPTVPSCAKCNNELGAIEQELFFRLAMCVDPTKFEFDGINKKLLESLGIILGNNNISQVELEKRNNKLNKILSGTINYKAGLKSFPGFGLHEGFAPEQQKAIMVPTEMLYKLSHKIIRGLEYKYGFRYIEAPFQIKHYFIDESIIEVEKILSVGKKTHFGPGFVVERSSAGDGSGSVIYRIIIWGTLKIYGSVLRQVG